MPRYRDQGYDRDRVARRRAWVEERVGCRLDHVGRFCDEPTDMRGNIENPIGASQVPLGVAGPLRVRGEHADGTFYVPFATTEGALVRSYERGMVSITRSGGADCAVTLDRNRICPSFFLESVGAGPGFRRLLRDRFEEIREVAEATTAHGRLLEIECRQYGRQMILEFVYDTADAQGMNMIAAATDAACRWLTRRTGNAHHLFSGMSSEKRASGWLMARGKGKWATAAATLPRKVVRSYLGCEPDEICRVWHSTTVGQIGADAVGSNGMVANGLAAIFIATGQDVANVANAACAVTDLKSSEDGLHAAVTLPALTVATVGGGTGLATQRECREMLGCSGDGHARKFAEIVVASLLAGEISMAAAIATGEFAAAHERYGRNPP